MKYWIETYGCQMNKAESDALEMELRQKGFVHAGSPETATLVVINTCSVRKTAEDRIWGRIGFYRRVKKQNKDMKLVITGCMAERLGEKLKGKNSPVSEVFGTFDKKSIADFAVDTDFTLNEYSDLYVFNEFHASMGGFKAFVPIMNGCNNFCSYCIVPYVRGREISRNPGEIYNEIENLEKMNFKEITLLGQNVNSYSHTDSNGKKIDFAELLENISYMTNSIEWIRFLTSHPKDLNSKLIGAIASSERVCRHIHLPVQSGSDNILKRMNRKYTVSHYLSLVSELKDKIPGISLTTDIIVGFPGETEKDFIDTCDLMEKVKFSDAFTYYYNPREGTKAYSFADDVGKEEKLERLAEIIELQRKISISIKEKSLGKTVKVLAEGLSKKNQNELIGRTEADEMIVFPGKSDKIGKMDNVKIISLSGNTYKGEVV